MRRPGEIDSPGDERHTLDRVVERHREMVVYRRVLGGENDVALSNRIGADDAAGVAVSAAFL